MPKAAFCADIHIEQGRSMERDGITIGLVSSNWAANKYEFVVHGEQAHTGSTVIEDRKDALLGASMLVVAARELANRFPGSPAHLRRTAQCLPQLTCRGAIAREPAA